MKKYLALLLAVAMLCAALVGCNNSSGGSEGTGKYGIDGREIAADQTYNSIYSQDVTTLNYLATGSTSELVIGANTIDPLVENDAYGKIVACGAESWTSENVEIDGVTRQEWTFKLKQGQYWYDHTGAQKDEVVAQDYVDSLIYVSDAVNACANFYLVRDYVLGAKEYYDWTYAQSVAVPKAEAVTSGDDADEYVVTEDGKIEEILYDDDGNFTGYAAVEEVTADSIGIEAVDKYTLKYTLKNPTPFFLTMMGFGCYWPAASAMLDQYAEDYGTENEKMWYNGPYILSDWQSNYQRVYTKNEKNWDADNVHITSIVQTCVDDTANQSTLYLQGEIDGCSLDSEMVAAWREDESLKNEISPTRVTADYSYFYAFEFDPQVHTTGDGQAFGITEENDKEWAMAAANENFRKAMYHGLNRTALYSVQYPLNYNDLILNTISPDQQYFDEAGKDYTTFGNLAAISSSNPSDETKAKSLMETAKSELQAQGVTFPLKVLLQYNGESWGKECQLLKQHLESLFGTDTFECVLGAYSGSSFLGDVRRARNYHFLKCNWGADYSDPQTWTDPFVDGNSYNHIDKSAYQNVLDMHAEYMTLVNAAKAETENNTDRFEAFAKAEAYLIEHAIVIPYGVTGGSYQCTKLNAFEGQYASYGQASSRYKGQYLYTTAMTEELFYEQLEKWEAKLSSGN